MKVFLASLEMRLATPNKNRVYETILKNIRKVYVLASFFYIRRGKIRQEYTKFLPMFKDFMLDSGAFSVMVSGKRMPDWNSYIEDYAEYVKENNIDKFLELDIDSVVGHDEVRKLRANLEKKAGKQCIPVWHRPRGKAEFLRLCDEYSYIAIGGVALKYIRPDEYRYLPYLIDEAHKRECKIHALGFTSTKLLSQYHFDSVDSSSWSMGRRYGLLYRYANGNISIYPKKKECRAINVIDLEAHNLEQWMKFQQYADIKL